MTSLPNHPTVERDTSPSDFRAVVIGVSAGGLEALSTLRKNITFANYNLVTDGVFGEMNLIVCRNVLIYFDRELQNRVLELFSQSLVRGGFLCLGTKESLSFSSVSDQFEVVDRKAKIYKKLSDSSRVN